MLNHRDHDQVLLWVNPKLRSCGSGPEICTLGTHVTGGGRVLHDAESETESNAAWFIVPSLNSDLPQMVTRHESNSLWT